MEGFVKTDGSDKLRPPKNENLMPMFKLVSDYRPAGDQPQALEKLAESLKAGKKYQTLLGVTGSGKTFTMANVIEKIQRPVLVISHNKTLAAQLYSEFKSFFPENAVEYFISYYDYYLPESYSPQTDTYIAKDASINEEIEKLRLSATASLLQRRDIIVVASVSCIYGLGSPEDYEGMCVIVKKGEECDRNDFLMELVSIQYDRNDIAPEKGQFRVRGDTVDVLMPHSDAMIKIEFWGSTMTSISKCDPLTGKTLEKLDSAVFFPCRHFVMPRDRIEGACSLILKEMRERVDCFEKEGKLVEAQRIYQRTNYDLEMIREIGYCSGIENYSVYLSKRARGSRPFCLIDFFPDDFITIIDESHVTIPQLRAMFKADRSRKQTLVDHGFRLPSALDNRPLNFDEFMALAKETVFVSATPTPFELELSGGCVEQVVRPTGLLDPKISVRPLKNQIDDLLGEIREYAARKERILVTTLTKKNAERLADYLSGLGINVKYLHSGLDALQRVKIICELRKGLFDCLVGINLLREGIDLPEVALVAILDADKEGFLRSETSLIQVAGRAARNVNGKVILYADRLTNSIKRLIEVSDERRGKQISFNAEHGIVPETIVKAIREDLAVYAESEKTTRKSAGRSFDEIPEEEIELELEKEMLAAAEALEYERAAYLRDLIRELKNKDDRGQPKAGRQKKSQRGKVSTYQR